ncbi:MAG: hypothetical protein F6K39_20585 [Okeania sp. SIO3B3]|nr:hypothetical protein [Okeania sp. SIO3B3]
MVFCWNKSQKNQIKLGKKNNLEFVPIPTARLKQKIAQLCEEYGIIFIETEESLLVWANSHLRSAKLRFICCGVLTELCGSKTPLHF